MQLRGFRMSGRLEIARVQKVFSEILQPPVLACSGTSQGSYKLARENRRIIAMGGKRASADSSNSRHTGFTISIKSRGIPVRANWRSTQARLSPLAWNVPPKSPQ